MREIEFRAKSKNKNFGWVYGMPVFDEDKQEYELRPETHTAFHIEQETLGQYTGLKDKNGKKIFEGDIVEVEFLNSSPTRLSVVAKNEKFIYKIIFKNGCFGLQSKIDRFTSFDSIYNTEFEVIGNIYDNPELVGEEV